MKRIVYSVLAALGVCALAWLMGYDFDERGGQAVGTALAAIGVAGFIYSCPLWDKEPK